jgi:hypothetical protein
VVAAVEDVETHDSDFRRAFCWNCYSKGHSQHSQKNCL